MLKEEKIKGNRALFKVLYSQTTDRKENMPLLEDL